MFEKFGFNKKLSKEEEIEKLLTNACEICKNLTNVELKKLDICDYQYSAKEAVEELGIDEELVHQLLEDYVIQVLKSIRQFHEYINKLRILNYSATKSDYDTLRELAHKNLGVARNLRVKDAEKLLYVLMKNDDLNYLELCAKALECCAIKLKPSCAYDTITLMNLKSTL